MSQLPNCPECNESLTYEDGFMYVCPMCGHEWSSEETEVTEEQEAVIRDANGNELVDGDDVTLIKDLKIKGSSEVLKQGTKAKGITLIEDAKDGHDIDCRIPGVGPMKLKSEFVKKV